MKIKKILEQVFFVFGTFATCLIVLAASDLQAHTLIAGKLGLSTDAGKSEHPVFSVCNDPEITARQGLILVEAMLQGPQLVARTCFENPEVNSCVPAQLELPKTESQDRSFEEFLAEINENQPPAYFTAAYYTN